MKVDVKKVANRRVVHYSTLGDLVRDAERLAAGQVRTLGNKSFGQILQHLTLVMNNSIDGSNITGQFSPFLRLVARLVKKRVLTKGLRAGFQLKPDADAKVWPPDDSLANSLAGLRKAVHRLETESKRGAHPAFGPMTVDEWNLFHMRHGELHMSFVVPA